MIYASSLYLSLLLAFVCVAHKSGIMFYMLKDKNLCDAVQCYVELLFDLLVRTVKYK